MRVAALYDVHGMVHALEAVLADVARERVDAIVFGGDVFEGPFPRETLELVRGLDGARFVRGNCERDPDERVREKLGAEAVAWSFAWPTTLELDGVLYCHATPAKRRADPDAGLARRVASTRPSQASTTGSSSRGTRTCSSGAAGSPTRARSGCRTKAMSRRSGPSSATTSSSAGRRSTSSARSTTSARPTGRGAWSSSPRTCARRRRAARRSSISSVSPDRVTVGRVGKPHGIAGAFAVELASEDAERFAVGARLYVDGREAEVVESKRARGRPVIRLDREAPRGAALEVDRIALPPPKQDEYYVFQLVGLDVERTDGKPLGRVVDVQHGRRERHPRAGRRPAPAARGGLRGEGRSRAGAESLSTPVSTGPTNLGRSLQLDVFTLLPHAFAWLTEQRPVATVLGDELDLRLFSYRDTTPLRAGQVDDDPYGGGAGMVLRVDVVAAALEAAYGPRSITASSRSRRRDGSSRRRSSRSSRPRST